VFIGAMVISVINYILATIIRKKGEKRD
jgi:uncharacterized membrane protein YvlD (DUF360 family)